MKFVSAIKGNCIDSGVPSDTYNGRILMARKFFQFY